MSESVPGRPIAVHNAAAARQTRFDSSSGTPDVRHFSANGPGPRRAQQRVVQRDRLKDRAQLVIAVRPGAKHTQIEIDLGVRARPHRMPFEGGAPSRQAGLPVEAPRA